VEVGVDDGAVAGPGVAAAVPRVAVADTTGVSVGVPAGDAVDGLMVAAWTWIVTVAVDVRPPAS
jgi:hypothetical protein